MENTQDTINKNPELKNDAESFAKKLGVIERRLDKAKVKYDKKDVGIEFVLTQNEAAWLEDNRELLGKIASDWTGHSVHVSCEITPTSASQLTIVEHEKILLERKNELKRKNARAFPQVKDILSVFTNSRITNIELSDA